MKEWRWDASHRARGTEMDRPTGGWQGTETGQMDVWAGEQGSLGAKEWPMDPQGTLHELSGMDQYF